MCAPSAHHATQLSARAGVDIDAINYATKYPTKISNESQIFLYPFLPFSENVSIFVEIRGYYISKKCVATPIFLREFQKPSERSTFSAWLLAQKPLF